MFWQFCHLGCIQLRAVELRGDDSDRRRTKRLDGDGRSATVSNEEAGVMEAAGTASETTMLEVHQLVLTSLLLGSKQRSQKENAQPICPINLDEEATTETLRQ